MTPQELKNSILQLAIQGKLVDQRPEEGTAEEQLKKKNKQPIAGDDSIDLPETWCWALMIDLTEILYGFPFNSERFNESQIGMPIIRIRDINNGRTKTYSDESCEERYRIRRGDMLVGMDGNFQVAFWNSDDAWLNQRVCRITANDALLEQKYLFFYLPIILKEINSSVSYSTVKHLSAKILNNLFIPLPPLAEQKRIIAKIEELLPLIDRYEKAWSRLEDFNKRFPGDMQKSILQMAIQGKLVEQRPEEGTAEELYRQIQSEKQALIKAGKIKKQKPLPEITEDEFPFDIPDSWRWIQIGEICSVVTGRLDANAQDPNGAYAFFTCGVEVYKTKDFAFDCDAVLLGGNNASGDYKMHRYVGKFNAYQRVYVITDPPKETLDYLFYVIKWWLPSLKHNSQGTTTRFIKLGQVTGMLVPVPPLAEQKRIVARLEELLPLCERLK